MNSKLLARVLLLLYLITFQTFAQERSVADLTIMTWNIWFDNPQNTDNPWSERKAGVLQTLVEWSPDLICVQEALENQVQDLEIPPYQHAGVGRDDGKMAGEYAAVFYNTDRLVSVNEGTFWLSDYPDSIGLIGWDAACTRICTWAELIHLPTNRNLFIFNTHFDHIGDTARTRSAYLILQKMNQLATGAPVVLTGDFNCIPGSGPYNILTDIGSGITLYDARKVAMNFSSDPDFTYVGASFTGEPGNIIDHFFVSGDWVTNEYRIVDNCTTGRCPSDHLPVVIKITFR